MWISLLWVHTPAVKSREGEWPPFDVVDVDSVTTCHLKCFFAAVQNEVDGPFHCQDLSVALRSIL